jgi:hypothetical protein
LADVVDISLDQFFQCRGVPRGCADIDRVLAPINIALQALGFVPGRGDRPAWPCTDREAARSPGRAVDQHKSFAARFKDAQAKARAVLVEYHIFPAANFGGFHNSFRQMRCHYYM